MSGLKVFHDATSFVFGTKSSAGAHARRSRQSANAGGHGISGLKVFDDAIGMSTSSSVEGVGMSG